jgi:1-acyl-sn-glycerol-3-phosphate acyltransferase
VCIFPEGRLTSDGEIGEFRAGMMRILKETPVPVVPLALTGLWDSMFSRKYGRCGAVGRGASGRRSVSRVGAPILPERASLQTLREAVVTLRGSDR